MKRLLALLLVFFILTLTGCNAAEDTSSDIDTNSSEIVSSLDESSSKTETSSEETASTETSSEVSSVETPKKESKPTTTTQSSSKTEISSITNNATSNTTTNNSTTMTFDENGVPILNDNLPYYWVSWTNDSNYTVTMYHQGGYYWDTEGNVYTEEEMGGMFNW